jgi:hypothetical protein
MIAVPGRGLVFLAQTKCASTSIEHALERFAQVLLQNEPRMKHMSVREFSEAAAPLLDRFGYPRQAYEIVCLIREPIEWLHSWWRYRARPELADPAHPRHANYAGQVSFDGFAEAYLEGGHAFAEVGRQADFLIDGMGNVGVDRLFRYEDLDLVLEYLQIKLGEKLPELDRLNVSPPNPLVLSDTGRRALEEFFRAEYALHAAADGQMPPDAETTRATPGLPSPFEIIARARQDAPPLVIIVGTGPATALAATEILRQLGAYVPEPFVPGDTPTLVPAWLAEFHQSVRDEAHLDLRSPRLDSITELTRHPAYERWADEATRWLLPLVAGDQVVCLNDPSLVWTLPIWAQVATALGRTLKVVVAVREPFGSMSGQVRMRRGHVTRAAVAGRAVERWINNALTAEWVTRGFDRLFITHVQLLEHPARAAERLGNNVLNLSADLQLAATATRPASPDSGVLAPGREWTPLNDLADRIYWQLRALATDSTGGTRDPAYGDALDALHLAYQSFRQLWKLETIEPTGLRLPRLLPGDAGPEVARLQALLGAAGIGVEVTGTFGDETADAVREFKRSRGLTEDPMCGRSCWGALLGLPSEREQVRRRDGAPSSTTADTSPVSGRAVSN